jgi:hypothetical protein
MTLHTAAPWVRTWLDGIAEEAERADEAAKRAEAIAASQEILRHQLWHSPEDVQLARETLRALGVQPEVRPRRVTVRPAPPPAPRIGYRMARDVLLGALVTVWAVYFLLIVVMA